MRQPYDCDRIGGAKMNLARSISSETESADEDILDIVVISYTTVGVVNGVGQSTVQVEAREILIPDRSSASYSVRFELSSGGDYPQETFASVAYKDIDRLTSMSKRLETTSISTDRFSFSEVQYEIGDLKIIVFNTDRGTSMAIIKSSNVSVTLSSPSKLSAFTALIEKARAHLDINKVP
ncbi:hypothetical protein Q4F19_05010 [Sphingomonas sp. BIUV-7]|uniref:DUF1795 domain-containing protein n=1 Tax=Sphingomonas natans TaxID=3063330 RepID=A0ABT8Y5Y8_9SPHN|nr:hypothetical protein [Sphingomonas sp. BIUV-7]MDO6413735.1 hypothetical protein [Sphingomonas sp. BIUV-7]